VIRKKRNYTIPDVRPLSVKSILEIHLFCRGAAAGGSQLCIIFNWTATHGSTLFFLSELRTRKAPAVFSTEENLSVSRSDLHPSTYQHGRVVPCTCARPAASLLPSTSRCLLSLHHFFSESAVAKNAARPERASFSRLHTYIAQEVLSSRFCIFFQLRHMPLNFEAGSLAFGTSHATSPFFRDVFLCLFFFLCLSQLLHFFIITLIHEFQGRYLKVIFKLTYILTKICCLLFLNSEQNRVRLVIWSRKTYKCL